MSSSEKKKRKKEKKMENKTSCPMSKCPFGGFCWKNPVHWFFGLAVLPFALDGLKLVWAAVRSIAG
jgi:hypothetical protein